MGSPKLPPTEAALLCLGGFGPFSPASAIQSAMALLRASPNTRVAPPDHSRRRKSREHSTLVLNSGGPLPPNLRPMYVAPSQNRDEIAPSNMPHGRGAIMYLSRSESRRRQR